jgi:hypothetical protein
MMRNDKCFEFRVVAQVNGILHGIVDTTRIDGEEDDRYDYDWVTSPVPGPIVKLSLNCSFFAERVQLPKKDGMAAKGMTVEFCRTNLIVWNRCP